MISGRAVLALAAAAGCIATGAWETARWFRAPKPTPATANPRWERLLAPLAAMPTAAGEAVALVLSADAERLDVEGGALYEAVWRRPDLRWVQLRVWPARHPPSAIVTVGAVPAPPGWRQVWEGGEVRLLRPAVP